MFGQTMVKRIGIRFTARKSLGKQFQKRWAQFKNTSCRGHNLFSLNLESLVLYSRESFIHFSLQCASSCPPILTFYSESNRLQVANRFRLIRCGAFMNLWDRASWRWRDCDVKDPRNCVCDNDNVAHLVFSNFHN